MPERISSSPCTLQQTKSQQATDLEFYKCSHNSFPFPNADAFHELIISVPHRQQDFAVNIYVDNRKHEFIILNAVKVDNLLKLKIIEVSNLIHVYLSREILFHFGQEF